MIWKLTSTEIIALITSFLALIISIRNLIIYGFFNKKKEKKRKINLEKAQQLVEVEINESINLSCDRIEFLRKQVEIRILQNLDNSLFVNMLQSYEEDLYQQYDRACNLYWENTINRERFKRIYKSEIIQLVQGDHQSLHFHNKKIQYPNILRVYKRWKSTTTSKKTIPLLEFQTS